MMSVPSTTERLSGEASTSIGKQVAGRRLAKRSSSLRKARRPALGTLLLRQVVPLGPADRPEQDGVTLLAEARRRGRQRPARRVDGGAADQRRARTRTRRRPPGRPRSAPSAPAASPPARCRLRAAPRSCTSPWSPPGAASARPCASRSRCSERAARRAARPTSGASGRSGRRPRSSRNRSHCGMRGDDQDGEDDEQQHPRRPAPGEVDLLEAVVAECGDHQDAPRDTSPRRWRPPASARARRCRRSSTTAATMPAAAGIGRPTK